MLFTSLFTSLVLLAIALGAIRSKHPFVIVGLCGFGLGIWPMLFGAGFFPPVLIQACLLLVAVGVCRFLVRRGWSFVAMSFVATVLAYGAAAGLALETQQKYARLREQFPYESMEARLPPPKQQSGQRSLPEATARRLGELEKSLPERTGGVRAYLLKELHEETVHLFIGSPGFGVGRMLRPSEYWLKSDLRPERVISQPNYRPTESRTSAKKESESLSLKEDFNGLHERSVADFVNPRGFGYLKDRRHVAGFQSHQFSESPEPAKHWELQSVDLVGLLMHEEPVAYISAHLPRMDELREAPTRSLDSFESVGLEELRSGHDLYIRDADGGVRMLGAIRAVKQCTSCHGCERGDLLGAFSYMLRQAER